MRIHIACGQAESEVERERQQRRLAEESVEMEKERRSDVERQVSEVRLLCAVTANQLLISVYMYHTLGMHRNVIRIELTVSCCHFHNKHYPRICLCVCKHVQYLLLSSLID